MKKSILLAAAAATVIITSCNKTPMVSGKGEPSMLTVTAVSPVTRATTPDTPSEAKVSTLDAFVFRGDVLDAYGKVYNNSSVSLSATQGDRTIYAVVNSEKLLNTVSSLAALKEEKSLLVNNNTTNFVMTGSVEKNLGTTATATVPVNRLAARFKIDKITNNLENSAQAASFSITRIFLTNVSGECTYEGASTGAKWFADTKLNAAGAPNIMIYKSLGSPVSVPARGSYTTSHSLYTYPNSSADKNTLLVIETKIGDNYYTYPIKIAETVERNKSYEIKELIIKHLGNSSDGDDDIEGDENKPIETGSIGVNVEVLDWEEVLVGDDGTITL